jgi:ribosome maturation factor RimP
MSRDLSESIRKLVEPIVSAEGLELVDLILKRGPKRWLLRIFIDHPEGINHGHCQNISRLVGAVLDVEDIIPKAYMLEVSSPGLDRPLKRPEDFDRFKERLIKIKLGFPINGKLLVKGRLKGIANNLVRVEGQEGLVSVPYENITEARLEVEFPAKHK